MKKYTHVFLSNSSLDGLIWMSRCLYVGQSFCLVSITAHVFKPKFYSPSSCCCRPAHVSHIKTRSVSIVMEWTMNISNVESMWSPVLPPGLSLILYESPATWQYLTQFYYVNMKIYLLDKYYWKLGSDYLQFMISCSHMSAYYPFLKHLYLMTSEPVTIHSQLIILV